MRRLAALAILLACLAQLVSAEEIYRKEASWATSMTATRAAMAKVGLKDIKSSAWFVSEPLPADSISDSRIPEDNVDRRIKDSEGRPLLRPQDRWEDGHSHGLNSRPKSLKYLYREIQVETPGDAQILFGCDNAAVIWFNGEKVHSSDGAPRCVPGQHAIPVQLRQGKNTLLMKLYIEARGGDFCFELPVASLDREVVYEDLYRKFWDGWTETDWFFQDNPYREPGAENLDPHRDFGWYFETQRDATAEQQMIRRVLDELGTAGDAFAARLESLVKAGASVDDPAWLELYVEACRVRRTQRLEPLLRLAPRIVFTKHYTMGGSHYAYTEGQSDAQAERNFAPRTALCLMQYDGRDVAVQTLLEDAGGVIRDPDVSYDGRRILFAWKKTDRDDDYHLYEMELESKAVRPITQGLGVADYEGVYLPDGDILFNSTRCVQTVDCWWTEVSNLYRCDKDGRFMRRLTFDQVHDNYPTVTEDGRILYTRWEYNDRGQVYTQPLLQMNPDGTNQQEFYGVNSWFPTTILHARGIPGTQKVLAIATGHHSRQTGKAIVIDPAKGRQENAGVQLVAPVRETPAVKIDAYGQNGELFQYPYPLSETEFLATYHPVGWPWSGSHGPRFGVYYMTTDGRRELLASDPELPCSQPVPLSPRRVSRARPTLVDYRKSEGSFYVQDVYVGPGLQGVPRGTVKTLRAVALDFRAAGVGSNGNGGPGGGAMISTPVAIGNGTWDPKIILGDATVYEDGSSFFRVPARTPIYFQLLDEKGRMVQTMRSWSTLQPGENAACVGCHEDKNKTPESHLPITMAVQAGVETLKPFYGPPRGFSFFREVQPMLDTKCASCHNGEKKEKEVPYDLTAREVEDRGAKRKWTQAYLALTHAWPDDKENNAGWRGRDGDPMVNWVSAQSAPPMQPPMSAGSNRSRLMELLDKGHEKVGLSREELDKLAAWIDLSVPFCGDYTEANTWTPEEIEKYQRYFDKRRTLAEEDKSNISQWLQSNPALRP